VGEISDLEEFADEKEALDEAAEELASAEAELKDRKKLQKDADAADKKECADDVKTAQKDVRQAEQKHKQEKNKLETAIKKKYGKVLKMVLQVRNAVSAVYDAVLISNGAESFERNLHGIGFLFATQIKGYCETAAKVTGDFTEQKLTNRIGVEKLLLMNGKAPLKLTDG